MIEYYRIRLMRASSKIRDNVTEETYIEIDGDKYRIIATSPLAFEGEVRLTLDKLTREEMKALFDKDPHIFNHVID
jgi:hypothetical protein